VVAIYAGTKGFLDDIPVPDIRRFETELIDFTKSKHGDLLEEIRSTGQLPDRERMDAAINEFKKLFSPSESSSD
jgi:F-type H+-transporting ATPase subunit alpha